MFTLSRKIDLRYKPNLIIVWLSLLVIAAGWLFFGEVQSGISLGGGFFLTWALTRELDPAHDYSAYIAAFLSLTMLFDFESIHFLSALWLLLQLRAVNGISGKKLTLFDLVSLLGLTVYLSLTDENSIYLLLFTLTMMLIRQSGSKPKAAGLAGMLAFILFNVQSTWMGGLSFHPVDFLNLLDIFIVAGPCFSLIVFQSLSRIEAEDDRGNRVAPSKLFASQVLYTVALLILFFFSNTTFNDQVIYLSAIAGAVLHFMTFKYKHT